MADIDSNLKQWSTTESNNKPTGATVIGTGLDENLRMIQTVVRQDLATKGADIASTGTMDIGAVAGFFHDITGTTTVVNLGTVSAGIWKILKFEGAVPLIHSTALTLPGATNITTADGDVMIVSSEGSGNWRVASYLPYAALMHKIVDAAGDLIVGTAADTVARLAEANWLRRGICDFRLTLTTAVPVTTSDVTGATTIYCAPYKGNQIALYDGTANWNIRASAEFSLALGTLTSGKPYDVFCYDNATVPTLEFLVWTNDTTRATALTTQDGVLVKTGATTRRYLGTFYTTSTTQTEDYAAKRFLWNYYNRVDRDLSFQMATDTWTYATDTLRAANNSAASSVSYVCGFAEDAIWAEVKCTLGAGTGLAATLGIGVDSTTVNSAQTFSEFTAGVALVVEQNACYCGQPSGVGLHTITWLERVRAGTVTFVGDNATPNNVQSGLIVGIKA